jgi:hypothetical protein
VSTTRRFAEQRARAPKPGRLVYDLYDKRTARRAQWLIRAR